SNVISPRATPTAMRSGWKTSRWSGIATLWKSELLMGKRVRRFPPPKAGPKLAPSHSLLVMLGRERPQTRHIDRDRPRRAGADRPRGYDTLRAAQSDPKGVGGIARQAADKIRHRRYSGHEGATARRDSPGAGRTHDQRTLATAAGGGRAA